MTATLRRASWGAASLLIGVALTASAALAAEGDASRGARVFRECAACHSLAPDRNMTGPSLAGLFGRKAGGLASFDRYSPALKAANVTWDDRTLDAWLKDPAQDIPGNRMTFAGIEDARVRADLIAYLHQATAPGAAQAAQSRGGMGGMMGGMGGMMGGGGAPDLKHAPPAQQVKAIRYCHDTYHVMTADGRTHDFWERNLRLKTDSSADGPEKGKPALVPAGMRGDRFDIIFADPGEIVPMIERRC